MGRYLSVRQFAGASPIPQPDKQSDTALDRAVRVANVTAEWLYAVLGPLFWSALLLGLIVAYSGG